MYVVSPQSTNSAGSSYITSSDYQFSSVSHLYSFGYCFSHYLHSLTVGILCLFLCQLGKLLNRYLVLSEQYKS